MDIVVAGRTCGGCKHRQPITDQKQEFIECWRNPPKVTTFIIGKGPDGGPLFHKDISRDLTRREWSCGEFAPRIEH